jgi:alpha-galactosidase
MHTKIFILFICLIVVNTIDNGLGLTPQMGWNSWNHFGCNINEQLIKQTTDLLVSTGLAAKGYVYVNLDDCWQVKLLPCSDCKKWDYL